MADRERYQQVSAIFSEACELRAEAREQLVRERCGHDAELLSLVKAMLDADERTPPDATVGAVRLSLESVLAGGETGSAPARCGPYTLGRLLGRGGMGEVYEATREDPSRHVALKIMHAARSSPASLRRFRREVASLARLSHPGISQLYEAGTFEPAGFSLPYFAMELVRGEPITSFAKRRGLTVQERLELIARVCDIVQFAHQQGVIHRDLKPSNILVSEPAAGKPEVKILDFGIARLLDESESDATLVTEQGLAIGTPGFMAPEQVRAGPGAVDTRADVYSLGALAYVLLSGQPALDLEGLSTFDAVKRVLEEDPLPLSSRDSRLRGDISLVVATAMRREPDRRYASAAEFALDLRRITRHEPVQAREPSAAYLLSRFARRHRVLVATATAAVVALAGFATVVAILYRREQAQRLLTERQRERADAEVRIQQEISQFLVKDTFGAAAPSRKGPSLRVVDVIDEAAGAVDQRFTNDPVLRGRVRATIANLYLGMGRYEQAESTATRAVGELRGTDVEGEVYFAELLRFQALALGRVNRPDEALAAYREAIAIADRIGPAGKTVGSSARAGFAELLQARGQHAEAQPLLRDLIALMPQEVTAQTDTDLATIMVGARLSLAASLSASGATGDERLLLLESASTLARAGLPQGHPGRLATLGSLASAYASMGRADDAMPLALEMLRSLESTFPADHPSVGMGLLSAATAHSAAGRHREACDFATRALSVFQRRFDADNFNVERAAGVAVSVHRAAGDREGVVRCFRPFLLARLFTATEGEGEGVIKRMGEFADAADALDPSAVEATFTQFIEEDCMRSALVLRSGSFEQSSKGARLAANLARGLFHLDGRLLDAKSRARTLLDRAKASLPASENRDEDEKLLRTTESLLR
jgi:eukaryotic-like serine/threonine-protein kinase